MGLNSTIRRGQQQLSKPSQTVSTTRNLTNERERTHGNRTNSLKETLPLQGTVNQKATHQRRLTANFRRMQIERGQTSHFIRKEGVGWQLGLLSPVLSQPWSGSEAKNGNTQWRGSIVVVETLHVECQREEPVLFPFSDEEAKTPPESGSGCLAMLARKVFKWKKCITQCEAWGFCCQVRGGEAR